MDKQKSILLIIPKYFGYEEEIVKRLTFMKFQVDIVFENIEECYYIYRFISRRLAKYREKYFNNYYKRHIKGKDYNIVLVIRGSSLYKNCIEDIRQKSPNAKFYMYQWDSIKNNINALAISRYFDKVSTFDIEDARMYGWNYRPLFYIEETERRKKRKFDIVYICSLHSQRLKIFESLKKYKNYSLYMYLFSKKSHYLKQKYVLGNKEFIGVRDNEVKFRPLALSETNRIMSDSNIIVDYTHPQQTGFTMRTIESIGHRCKLITNNKMVLESDFYNVNNVYLYEVNNFKIPEEFINSKYVTLSDMTYIKYSIDQWLKEILDIC